MPQNLSIFENYVAQKLDLRTLKLWNCERVGRAFKCIRKEKRRKRQFRILLALYSTGFLYPTGPFTIEEPQYQEIDEFHVVQARQVTDFEVLKLWKGRSGTFYSARKKERLSLTFSLACFLAQKQICLSQPKRSWHANKAAGNKYKNIIGERGMYVVYAADRQLEGGGKLWRRVSAQNNSLRLT